VNGNALAVGAAVAIGALGGAQSNSVVSSVWQVSMVIMTLPCGILAAPQQSPSLQVVSPLLGLKVPFDRAFSHLDPSAPLAGGSAERRAAMVSRSAALWAIAALRVVVYASNLASLHVTAAARWAP